MLYSAMNIQNLALQLQGTTWPGPSSSNQRAYADMLEELACNHAMQQFPNNYLPARTVRSLEDFSLNHHAQVNYVDVKTRQLGTDFNMPNLISVDRLDKLLDKSHTELYYWLIDYRVALDGTCTVCHSEIRSVWSLPWSALAIQNLGLGQLQIANWPELTTHACDRQAWHQQLKHHRKQFYLKQANKFQRMAQAIEL